MENTSFGLTYSSTILALLQGSAQKQHIKDKQGNAEANSVMYQMANKIRALEQLTKSQRSTLNKILDQINDFNSHKDRLIPAVIDIQEVAEKVQ